MRDEGGEPLLTVIVPVYNEARTVEELLRRVLAAPYDKQITVVDDGSTDGTAAILQRWKRHAQVEVLTHPTNRGKGAAIRTGLQHARGRFTIIQDADLEYDPQDYPLLIEPLLRGEAGVVYGSRNLAKGPDRAPWSVYRCGVMLLNWCVRVLYGRRITDEATCYKAFPTEVLKAMDLKCERFEFCPEVTAKACRMGLAIREVPIHYRARGVKEGKKLRLQDGWAALKTLWRWRSWQRGEAVRAVGPALPAIAMRPAQPALQVARFGRHSRPYGFTIVELLVVIGIIGMLMALLLPAVQSARESVRRAQCANHLRQLGLAMQHHVSDFGRYPTNGWGYLWVGCPDRGTDVNQPGGWIYNILPYIEQSNLRAMGRGQPAAQQRQALAKMTQTPVAGS
jgi:prepilin-type N-terminal cleavage/methylation domain-containing protein